MFNIDTYNEISQKTNASIADIIVLAGNTAIEKASGLEVPFMPGRGDATQEDTDIESFSVLEPLSDGFRNFQKDNYSVTPEEMLIDRAQLMGLSAPEMTVLFGGLRSLGISSNGHGLLTKHPGKLSSDFFSNILDINTELKPHGINTFSVDNVLPKLSSTTVTQVDLIFASNSELRAISEVYACDDNQIKFSNDFVEAWTKVMNLDRFDVF